MECRTGFFVTDEEDSTDKVLLRLFGFTIFGVSYLRRGWLQITLLGVWIQWYLL